MSQLAWGQTIGCDQVDATVLMRVAPSTGWGQKPWLAGFKQEERKYTEWGGGQLWRGFCYNEGHYPEAIMESRQGLLLFIIVITYLYIDEIIL